MCSSIFCFHYKVIKALHMQDLLQQGRISGPYVGFQLVNSEMENALIHK